MTWFKFLWCRISLRPCVGDALEMCQALWEWACQGKCLYLKLFSEEPCWRPSWNQPVVSRRQKIWRQLPEHSLPAAVWDASVAPHILLSLPFLLLLLLWPLGRLTKAGGPYCPFEGCVWEAMREGREKPSPTLSALVSWPYRLLHTTYHSSRSASAQLVPLDFSCWCHCGMEMTLGEVRMTRFQHLSFLGLSQCQFLYVSCHPLTTTLGMGGENPPLPSSKWRVCHRARRGLARVGVVCRIEGLGRFVGRAAFVSFASRTPTYISGALN